jgi:hypothetical protein
LSPDFRESDWKILRELKTVALDRFCRRILDEVARLCGEPGKSDHQRYLAVYKHIHERDEDIVAIFNEMTRSRALLKLCAMRRHDLMTDDEFARFSEETRDEVGRILARLR